MRKWGITLLVVGVLWCLFAFSVDTTISSGTSRVHNIGLMDERRNHLMLAGLLVIVGAILFAASAQKETRPEAQGEFHAAIASPIARSLDSGAYQLYLVEKYRIVKNDVLEKYVLGTQVIDSLDEALQIAHSRDVAAYDAQRKREEEQRREAQLKSEQLRKDAEKRATAHAALISEMRKLKRPLALFGVAVAAIATIIWGANRIHVALEESRVVQEESLQESLHPKLKARIAFAANLNNHVRANVVPTTWGGRVWSIALAGPESTWLALTTLASDDDSLKAFVTQTEEWLRQAGRIEDFKMLRFTHIVISAPAASDTYYYDIASQQAFTTAPTAK